MKKITGIKKYLLIGLGFISLVLGVVGIFLPVLPTTPFILLTAFCFVRTSSKLYQWLLKHRLIGNYILDYINHRALKKETKMIALVWLWGGIGISMFMVSSVYIKVALAIIAIGVSAHILSLRSRQHSVNIAKGFRTDSILK